MQKTCQGLNKRNRVLRAMFDVRPVKESGILDIEKINQIAAVLDLRGKVIEAENFPGENIFLEEGRPPLSEEKHFISEEESAALVSPEEIFLPRITEQHGHKSVDECVKNKKGIAQSHRRKQVVRGLSSENQTDLAIEPWPTRDEILAELARIDDEEERIKAVFVSAKPEPNLVLASRLKNPDFSAVSYGPDEDYFFNELFLSKKEEKTEKRQVVLNPDNYFNDNSFNSLRIISRRRFFGLAVFLLVGLSVSLTIPVLSWVDEGWRAKEKITASSLAAYENLSAAQNFLEETDFKGAGEKFTLAYDNFFEANEEINGLGKLTLTILEQLPGGSLVSAGSHLVKVGENLSLAGRKAADVINALKVGDSIFRFESGHEVFRPGGSLTDSLAQSQEKLEQALEAVSLAGQELDQVEMAILPPGLQEKVLFLKNQLPSVEKFFSQAKDYSAALLSILGHNNSRQYLLLFQNNSEIRATGGFIGTYGLLTLDRGRIKRLFIDGVFNPDGQLREKIIPPKPIQKISTAWSMHDANWFFDFPASARKILWFYEKSGGPTVDGVITLTPAVAERLLKLTGPVEMPEYKTTLTSENFVELIQYKVEEDYDKELNQPKKILADFAPKFIQLLAQLPPEKQPEVLEIILESLKEKHILIYFNDEPLEEFIQEQGWAGEILETTKDYLAVVSSNINGYKTDRVINESIEHQAELQKDGSIIDTATIIRRHEGGQLNYDWWNKVNSNYLRVYLPLGSELLSASGQTLETYFPPIDYQKHGFREDPLVKAIEDKMTIDQKTGTHIFKENGKTVFGNWVYLSPGETMRLTYQYKLPFKVDLTKSGDSYSLLVQKQAGSSGSAFKSVVKFPENWSAPWSYPTGSQAGAGTWEMKADLSQDRFLGMTFGF